LLSHAVAALGVGACFYKPGIPKRVWVIGIACSVIPDFGRGVGCGQVVGNPYLGITSE
jgi:hypothetical protein